LSEKKFTMRINCDSAFSCGQTSILSDKFDACTDFNVALESVRFWQTCVGTYWF